MNDGNWTRKQARLGDSQAMLALGDLYSNGWNWPHSTAKARRWYLKAAARRQPLAMLALYWQYHRWCETSLKQQRRRERLADYWLGEAVRCGSSEAKALLAFQLLGAAETEAAGLDWLHQAAECGELDAMVELATRYETGHGLNADRAEALMWFTLASERPEARERRLELTRNLSQAERLESKERLVAWQRRRAVDLILGDDPPAVESEGYGVIEPHERAIGKILADQGRLPYRPLRSLDEARAYPDAVVIAEGDSGGQVYFTCPVRLIRCTEAELMLLLEDVDATRWGAFDNGGAGLYYERLSVGDGVWGGMGGGVINEGVWVHDGLCDVGDDAAVRAVVEGRARFFSQPLPEDVRARAAAGDPTAMYRLANRPEWTKDGLPVDDPPTLALLHQAAALGHLGAQRDLSIAYEAGWWGAPRDAARAVHWLLSLEAADPDGRRGRPSRLAHHFETGEGIARDGRRAMACYARSVSSPKDMVDMGWRYLNGTLVSPDPAEARKWFERALAEGRYGEPLYAFGLMHLHGWGTARDKVSAREWFRRAANEDDLKGMLRYAVCLANGIGGPRDESEALFWALQAERWETPHASQVVVCLKARLGSKATRKVENRLKAPRRR
ncbi:MAG: tetratricopeptide repeat protein [Candidatus Sericytochromatia bacterium]